MRRLGLDPTTIRGSGPNGRIVEADLANTGAASAPAPAPGLSAMRQAIAQRTAESFSSTPHFYLRAEADVTTLLELRRELLPEVEQQTGVRLTLTDFLLRALGLALRDYPKANRIWQNGTVVQLATVDVGLVVGLEDGIFIAVLREVDRLSLAKVAQARAGLVAAARNGRLKRADTQGGASTLSNLGKSRVDEFAAVINSPQSSILAVGRAAPRPVVCDGALAVRTTLKCCLSVDHRVLDGEPAAEFLGRVLYYLESPALLAG